MSDIRLIERWLPIAEIGIESLRERTPMTPFPAPNRLHVWWARRPLVASRAAILASFSLRMRTTTNLSASSEFAVTLLRQSCAWRSQTAQVNDSARMPMGIRVRLSGRQMNKTVLGLMV